MRMTFFQQRHLIMINVGTPLCRLTKEKETDLIFFDVETGQISRQVKFNEVIVDQAKSKCRFVACNGQKVFLADIGKFVSALNFV